MTDFVTNQVQDVITINREAARVAFDIALGQVQVKRCAFVNLLTNQRCDNVAPSGKSFCYTVPTHAKYNNPKKRDARLRDQQQPQPSIPYHQQMQVEEIKDEQPAGEMDIDPVVELPYSPPRIDIENSIVQGINNCHLGDRQRT